MVEGTRPRPAAPRRAILALLALGLGFGACGPSIPPSPSSAPSRLSPGATGSTVAGPSVGPGAGPSGAVRRVEPSLLGVRLPGRLSRAVAFSVGGDIVVCGGLESNGSTAATILRIDLRAGTVAPVGTLAVAVHDAAGAELPAGDIVFGGGQTVALTTIQRCDPSGSSVIGSLPSPRADLAALAVPGLGAIILGGGTSTNLPTPVLQTADGVRLRAIASLVAGVRYAAVAGIGQTVLVIGGYRAGADVSEIQAVDLGTGTSRVIGHLPVPLAHASALVLGSTIVVAGGQRSAVPESAIWVIDPTTGRVSQVGNLPSPRSGAAAVVVAGIGYLIGGEDASGQLDSVVSLAAG